MSERVTASEATAASAGEPTRTELTRAEARALSRCAPLTPAEFKARRRVAEQGIVSLRGLLLEPEQRPQPGARGH